MSDDTTLQGADMSYKGNIPGTIRPAISSPEISRETPRVGGEISGREKEKLAQAERLKDLADQERRIDDEIKSLQTTREEYEKLMTELRAGLATMNANYLPEEILATPVVTEPTVAPALEVPTPATSEIIPEGNTIVLEAKPEIQIQAPINSTKNVLRPRVPTNDDEAARRAIAKLIPVTEKGIMDGSTDLIPPTISAPTKINEEPVEPPAINTNNIPESAPIINSTEDVIPSVPEIKDEAPTPEIIPDQNVNNLLGISEEDLETENLHSAEDAKREIIGPVPDMTFNVNSGFTTPETPKETAPATIEPKLSAQEDRSGSVTNLIEALDKNVTDWSNITGRYVPATTPETIATPVTPEKKSWKETLSPEQKTLLEQLSSPLALEVFISNHIKGTTSPDFSKNILKATCDSIFNGKTNKSIFGSLEGVTVDGGEDHRQEIITLLELLDGLNTASLGNESENHSSPELTVNDFIEHVKSNILKANSDINN